MTDRERIDAIAEIVAEIWRSGKEDSQVFDFHECGIRQRWVARLNGLLRLLPKLELIGGEEQFQCSLISKYPYKYIADVIKEACNFQLAADQKAIEGVKE